MRKPAEEATAKDVAPQEQASFGKWCKILDHLFLSYKARMHVRDLDN